MKKERKYIRANYEKLLPPYLVLMAKGKIYRYQVIDLTPESVKVDMSENPYKKATVIKEALLEIPPYTAILLKIELKRIDIKNTEIHGTFSFQNKKIFQNKKMCIPWMRRIKNMLDEKI